MYVEVKVIMSDDGKLMFTRYVTIVMNICTKDNTIDITVL